MKDVSASPPAPSFTFASPAEAVAAMRQRVREVTMEIVPLYNAFGRILAEPVAADRANPPTDVSVMDGYAVRLSDLTQSRLEISGEVRIGREPGVLPCAKAVRIVTGAAIPVGTDAVVPCEDVQEHPTHIVLARSVVDSLRRGVNIRRRGENAAAGAIVLPAGALIGPAVAGALATFGLTQPRLFRKVRVGVLVTGDEVLPPEARPSMWQVRDCHSAALAAMLTTHAWLDPAPPAHVHDDPAQLRQSLRSALADCDAVLITGGVSKGARDFVPQAVRDCGATVVFHRLPQRPGKPMLGAVTPDGRLLLGLPGNPLSVMVTALRIAIPVLGRMAGLRDLPAPTSFVTLTNDDGRRSDLWRHRLVRRLELDLAELVSSAGSGDAPAAARSDGVIEVPPGRTGPGPWPFRAWSFQHS